MEAIGPGLGRGQRVLETVLGIVFADYAHIQ